MRIEKIRKPVRLFYAAGPGDIMKSFEYWASNRKDPHQLANTYSSEFFDLVERNGWKGLAVSRHASKACKVSGNIEVQHVPLLLKRAKGILYQLDQMIYALRMCWLCLKYRSSHAIISDGSGFWFLFWILRLFGVKIIPCLHCHYRSFSKQSCRKSILDRLNLTFFKSGIVSALTVSEGIKHELRALGIPSTVPLYRFFPQYDKEVLSRDDFIETGKALLYVGRIEEEKGVFDLLHAYRSLKARIPDAPPLVFCGSGSAENRLRESIQKLNLEGHAELKGLLRDSDLVEMYRSSGCIIVPTRSDFAEGFNKVVLEGLLFNKPVIVTRVCPSASEFEESINIVTEDSPEAIADKLEKYLLGKLKDRKESDFSKFCDSECGWRKAVESAINAITQTKIGYLVPEFPSQTHAFFWREIQAIRDNGEQVVLFSTRKPEATACRHVFKEEALKETEYLFPFGVRGLFVMGTTPPKVIFKAMNYIFALSQKTLKARMKQILILLSSFELLARIRRSNVRHLHIHSCADSALLGALVNVIGEIPYSLSIHGDLEIYGHDHGEKFSRARKVFPVTKALLNRIRNEGLVSGEQAKVIRMGVDVEKFHPALPKKRSGEVLRLVMVSRLNRMKGHAFALEAIHDLKNSGVKCHLDIIGDGKEYAHILHHIEELSLEYEVSLHGNCSEKEVYNHLIRADVFVLPSFGKGEAAPVALMEAMACELPVIATNVGGVSELVKDGVNGIVVPPKNVRALKNAIEVLYRHSELCHEMGRNARKFSVANCDYRDWAKRLVDEINVPVMQNSLPASATVGSSLPKVLAVVEQCHPHWTSVPLVAFNWLKHLSERTRLTVITHERNREVLETQDLPITFHYIKESKILRCYYVLMRRLIPGGCKNWPLLHFLTYPVYSEFNKKVLHWYESSPGNSWDVIWGFTPMLPRYPYNLAQLKSRPPFVLGPVNGGIPFPPDFKEEATKEFSKYYLLRHLGKWIPGYRKTYQMADVVIAGSKYTRNYITSSIGVDAEKVLYCPENGVEQRFFRLNPSIRDSDSKLLRLLYAGRLTAYKGCHLVIKAIGGLEEDVRRQIRLEIVGNGPELANLQDLVKSLNLDENVSFSGFIPHREMHKVYARSHVFCFPSIREFGGAVVMEAMASGLPCIVANYGGIKEYTTEASSFKIDPISSDYIISEIRIALSELCRSEPFRRALSVESRKASSAFLWERKAEWLNHLFKSLSKNSNDHASTEDMPINRVA